MKKRFIAAAIFAALFLLLIAAVKTADVSAIGPQGTYIGLSSLNGAVHRLLGVHMPWYYLTQWLGAAAIAVAAAFAVTGLLQLLKRKSLFKVDRQIISLGVLYAVTIALYLFFELVVVNYRPVVMPGADAPEASFPSSHTMLICVVMGSAAMLCGKYVRGKSLRLALRICCTAVIAVTVIGRLVCGVHWFSDILGGALLSGALLSLYAGVNGY